MICGCDSCSLIKAKFTIQIMYHRAGAADYSWKACPCNNCWPYSSKADVLTLLISWANTDTIEYLDVKSCKTHHLLNQWVLVFVSVLDRLVDQVHISSEASTTFNFIRQWIPQRSWPCSKNFGYVLIFSKAWPTMIQSKEIPGWCWPYEKFTWFLFTHWLTLD